MNFILFLYCVQFFINMVTYSQRYPINCREKPLHYNLYTVNIFFQRWAISWYKKKGWITKKSFTWFFKTLNNTSFFTVLGECVKTNQRQQFYALLMDFFIAQRYSSTWLQVRKLVTSRDISWTNHWYGLDVYSVKISTLNRCICLIIFCSQKIIASTSWFNVLPAQGLCKIPNWVLYDKGAMYTYALIRLRRSRSFSDYFRGQIAALRSAGSSWNKDCFAYGLSFSILCQQHNCRYAKRML